MVNLWYIRGLQSLETALAAAPAFAPAAVCYGAALSAIGRHTDAVRAFERARALRPTYYDATRQLGLSLLAATSQTGVPAEREPLQRAAAVLAQAAAMRPSDPTAMHEYASALGSVGARHAQSARFADAALCFRRAINATPSDAGLYRHLANALTDHGGKRQAAKAVRALEAALRLRPHDAQITGELQAARLRRAVTRAGGWSRSVEAAARVQAEVRADGMADGTSLAQQPNALPVDDEDADER